MLIQASIVLAAVALILGVGLVIGAITRAVPGWAAVIGLILIIGALVSITFAIDNANVYGWLAW